MCTGMEIAAIIGASSMAYTALSAPTPSAPNIPQPTKPPQASKQPDTQAIAGKNMTAALPGGPMAGNSGTFLTGPGGVDPGTLNLGKNTLLGQ